MKKVTANKGEWSELYTFLKILDTPTVATANEKLEAETNDFFLFKAILRNEIDHILIYEILDDGILIKDEHGTVLDKCSRDIFIELPTIFKSIQNGKGRGAFALPCVDSTIQSLQCSKIKASSQKKADLEGQFIYKDLPLTHFMGFSIKSFLKGRSTLLNTSGATEIIYTIKGLSSEKAKEINAITGRAKYQRRVKKIYELGGELVLQSFASNTFEANLKKLDTKLPEFLARIVIQYFRSNGPQLTKLISSLAQDPYLAHHDLDESDYQFKFKELLRAAVVGMMPNTLWPGLDGNFAGMLLVKDTGEILCSSYSLHRDKFLSSLFNNSFFDTPSSKRHKFGQIENIGTNMSIKLNFQIRIKD